MFEPILEKLLAVILNGNTSAIAAIFIGISCGLIWYVFRLEATIKRKDDRIDEVIQNYHDGNKALSNTINELKMMLYEIRIKL